MSAQLSIAVQLRKLASDPASQTFICQEQTCLSGLLSLLNAPDSTETLIVSLQALLFLSSHPSCKDVLARQPGLVVRLTRLTEHDDAQVSKLVSQVLGELQATVNKERSAASAAEQGRRLTLRRGAAAAGCLHSLILQLSRAGEGGGSSDAGSLLLLSAEERSRVEKRCIVVPGVISVSVTKAGQLTVYTKREEHAPLTRGLQQQLTAVDASLVISSVHSNAGVDKENAASSSSAASTPSSSSSSQVSGSRALVAATSFEQNSLQNRFQARQRKAAETDNKQGMVRGLFSSVSSFFW